MNTLARICFSLAVFLAVAGTVYGLTSHEPAGTTLLAVAAIDVLLPRGRLADGGTP